MDEALGLITNAEKKLDVEVEKNTSVQSSYGVDTASIFKEAVSFLGHSTESHSTWEHLRCYSGDQRHDFFTVTPGIMVSHRNLSSNILCVFDLWLKE